MKRIKLFALLLASVLTTSLVQPIYSYAEEETTPIVETEEELDVKPTAGPVNVEFKNGENEELKIPVTWGSGQYKADSAFATVRDKNGELVNWDYCNGGDSKNVTLWLIDELDKKAGTYTIWVEFSKNTSTDANINLEKICEVQAGTITVTENIEHFSSIRGKQSFDGSQDIVFKFQTGTGQNAVKEFQEVIVNKSGDIEPQEGYVNSFSSTKAGTDFTYDLEKGEFVIKKEFVKQIANEGKKFYDTYYVDTKGLLKNGEECYVVSSWTQPIWVVNFTNYHPEINVPEENKPEENTPVSDVYEVTLASDKTSLSKDDMKEVVEKNKTQDVVIKTANGVTFTFVKETMKLTDGKAAYDFGVKLITDYANAGEIAVTDDEFAFRINYNYSGQLPGEAKISIPLDKKWAGKTLYYNELLADGTTKYMAEAKVDANGIYTITQEHCSDYVAVQKVIKIEKPKENNNTSSVVKTADKKNPDKSTSDKKAENNRSPKTGDETSVLPYMLLCAGACVVLSLRRKFR